MNLKRMLETTMNPAICCFLAAICAAAAPASAGAVVQWTVADGGNGHFYEAVTAPNTTWNAARDAAAIRIHNGSTGYLATFATGTEQSWVVAALGGGAAIDVMWLGGYQDFADPGYSEPAGGWKWITGEPFLLSGPDAPVLSFNDAYYIPADGERYTCTWWGTGGINDFNDTANAADVAGYIVEYEPVPEPACLALLALATTSLCRRRACCPLAR